jgi:acyl carrier protein phosphodiesterase
VVGENSDHQIGAFLGDFVKGPLVSQRSLLIEQGIWHHRQLDAWSNQHIGLRGAAEAFGEDHRRVAPILLDLFIDHFLCHHWHQHASLSLQEFSNNFYNAMTAKFSILPDRAKNWLLYAKEHDLLAGYGDINRLRNIVKSMDERRRKPLGLSAAFDAGIDNYSKLEKEFHQVFPDIIQYANSLNNELPESFEISQQS